MSKTRERTQPERMRLLWARAYTHEIGSEWIQAAADELADAADRIDLLEGALRGMLERYVDLVNSGDCGFWDPESEEPVKAARAALEAKP